MIALVMAAALVSGNGPVSFADAAGAPSGEWRFVTAEGFKTNAPAVAAAFARDVVNASRVTKAEAFVTSLGCFELYVNDRLVSVAADGNRDDFLRPGYTDRAKRRLSLGYDVTGLWQLEKGATNALSAFVAQTWFADQPGRFIRMAEMLPPSLAAQVRLTYADGTTSVVETDGRWCASFNTPFARAGIYEGETYDARSNACARVCAGRRPAVDESRYRGQVTPTVGALVSLREDKTLVPEAASVCKGAEGAVKGVAHGRAKVIRRYDRGAKEMRLAKGETLVVDFGQNAAAVPVVVASAARGTVLSFKGAEMLNDANGELSRGCDGPAGSPYFANYRSLKGADRGSVSYVFAGAGEEVYRPTFTFMGYRYAALTATDDVTIRSIVSVPVTSVAKADERGTLVTGDKDVNRLISNILWGQYSNYVSVPTDCPQRDERLGWMADTQVFTRAAFYNADVCDFLRKWMGDVRDGQGAEGAYPNFAPGRAGDRSEFGWADAGVIVPWTAWRMTGRTDIVEENWESMVRYLDSTAADNAVYPGVWTFGDWLTFERWESCSAACCESNDGKGDCWPWPGAKRLWDFLYGCYWMTDAEKMAEMAEATGRNPERYREMAARARNRLKTGFFEADGGLLKDFRDMQTPTLFALKTGLYRDEKAKAAAVEGLLANFKAHGDCLQTGFLGTSVLMDALTYGAERPDMAYTLLLQHGFPSWLYSVDQGATTIWERWNSYTKKDGFGPVDMNSFNHYAYGSVLGWMYATMAGIQPGPKGGFDGEFRLAPIPDPRLGFVEATYRTKDGLVRSAWKYENGRCLWRFSVPKGSRATVAANGVEKVYGPGDHEVELLTAKGERTGGAFDGFERAEDMPGAVSMIWTGKETLVETSGYADLASKRPISTNDLFWIASNTKAIACALMLRQIDRGLVGLDRPVADYLPAWKEIRLKDGRPPSHPPTVRELMGHTAGLAFFPKMPITQFSVQELAAMAVTNGLDHDVGTYLYSNWGIDVAMAVVERVTGRPWDKALADEVLKPLGMDDTTFFPSEKAVATRLATSYRLDPYHPDAAPKAQTVDQLVVPYDRPGTHAEAGGGLFSTAPDLLKFFRMVASHGRLPDGTQLVSEGLMREWYGLTDYFRDRKYTFGMDADAAHGFVRHGGAYGTDGAANWKRGTARVFMTQVALWTARSTARRRNWEDYAATWLDVGADRVLRLEASWFGVKPEAAPAENAKGLQQAIDDCVTTGGDGRITIPKGVVKTLPYVQKPRVTVVCGEGATLEVVAR